MEHEDDGGYVDGVDRMAAVQGRLADELKRQNDINEKFLKAEEARRAEAPVGTYMTVPAEMTAEEKATQQAWARESEVQKVALDIYVHDGGTGICVSGAFKRAEAFVTNARARREAHANQHGYDVDSNFGVAFRRRARK